MATLAAETWARILGGALEHRPKLEAEPGLQWQIMRLQQDQEAILAVTGTLRAQDVISRQRKRVRAADDVHDDTHRYFNAQFSAHLYQGSAEERETVRVALEMLYPDGLRNIQAAYEKEAAAAATFEQRLARPEAEAAFVIIEAHVPRIRDYGAACVTAARVLGEELRTLDAQEAEAEGERERSLFKLARNARITWELFANTVETLYNEDSPEHRERRETFLGPWKRALAALRQGAPPSSTPDTPPDATNTTDSSDKNPAAEDSPPEDKAR